MNTEFKKLLLGAILIFSFSSCASQPASIPDETIIEEYVPHIPRPMPSPAINQNSPLVRIALGSCYAPQLENDEIWNSIIEARPDLFLFLGDNVYQSEETGDPQLLELKDAYGWLAEVDSFNALRKNTPMMVTWDDHDYGLNDAGAEFGAKYQSEKIFEYAWAVSDDDPRSQRDGVYYSQIVGTEGKRTQIIVLDTRFFRSPLPSKDGSEPKASKAMAPNTMLGEEQWLWLEQELQKAANLRFIVSSVQVIAEGHGAEGWYVFPQERQKLYDLIAKFKTNGVIFLSGDRHVAGFYKADETAPYAIPEFTSSSLNFPISGKRRDQVVIEPDLNRIDNFYGAANFGTIDIDWDSRSVLLSIKDEAGVTAREHSISIGDLRAQ